MSEGPRSAGALARQAAGLQQCVGADGDAALGITGALRGTGYDGAAVSADSTVLAVNGSKYVYGGGTGWLTAKFPVVPGEELIVRVIIHDTFDGLKDSAYWSTGSTGSRTTRAARSARISVSSTAFPSRKLRSSRTTRYPFG